MEPVSRRASRASAGAAPESPLEAAAAWLLGAIVVGSVLAVGTVHLPVLLVVGALVTASTAIAARAARRVGLPCPPPAIVALALAAWSALQAVPIPMRWLEAIAPANADVWARALLPLGEAAPARASVSIDPGASLIEALKWALYAGTFATAAFVAARRGAVLGIGLVVAAAAVAALTTIGHGLAGARAVWGLYEPSFAVSPWHVGPLLNPNNLAGYLNLGVLCALGLLLMRNPPVPRWAMGVVVALLVGVEITSASRAGVAALPAAVVVLALLLRRRASRSGREQPEAEGEGEAGRRRARAMRRPEATKWLLGAALGGGAMLALLGGAEQAWQELYDDSAEKLGMVGWVKPLVRDHPVLGIGRGAFESVFPAYRVTAGHGVYTHAENFPAQWASEWGLPVAVLALAAFAWTLRPSRLGARRGALALGAMVGAAALLVQNLFDLGLEIPAVCIALATALGSLHGDAVRRRGGEREARRPSRRSGVWAAGGVVVAGAALSFAALRWGWHDVASDRAAVRRAFEAASASGDATKAARLAALRAHLREAMRRHPAEPYFSLVGALAAWTAKDESPIPWLQRTLERSQISGRAHLLLAEVLGAQGRTGQALFELRLAAEHDTALAPHAARLAVRWTSDPDELVTAVPDGPLGGAMLDAMGERLARIGRREAGARVDAQAIARDPHLVGPRLRKGAELVAAIVRAEPEGPCAERERCEKEVLAHVAALEASEPRASHGARLRARLLVATGRVAEAEKLLDAACETASDRPACLMAKLEAAADAKSTARLDPIAKELLSASCRTEAACAEAAAWIGELRASRGDWGAAVGYFARAAREQPSEARWLRLAEAATRAGAHAEAAAALEKVAQQRGGGDEALQKRIREARERALGGILVP